ncbi:MAG: 2OG-Fe(II) oxygenase [Hyphomicrobiaceae bacterium]|nr:2OG-Fe(II) oxygenase [Hyphomicrobiaceae bacterium]
MGQAARVKPEPRFSLNSVSRSFLGCLANAQHRTHPFDHWLLTNPLPEDFCEAIASLPFAPPCDGVFDGKRETNNNTRIYFTPENQQNFVVCRRTVEGFEDPAVRRLIEDVTGTDLTGTRLRIEYCQDTDGFWLEPHTDIPVKRFTMLVYLSDDPSMAGAGTDLHEGPPDFKYVGSAPYGKNLGVIFIPGKNTWHGVGHNRFRGIRKSIIINYVTPDWRDTWELA